MQNIIRGVALVAILSACGAPGADPADAGSDGGDQDILVDMGSTPDDQGSTPSDLGGIPSDGGLGTDAATCACDDGVACTEDTCSQSGCEHVPVHQRCPSGGFCDATSGCTGGPICADDASCTQFDPCLLPSCDPASRICVYAVLDGDDDGEPPLVCQGRDCNDGDAEIHPDVDDSCDGVDNDCDGSMDEDGDASCAGFATCVDGSCECQSPFLSCGQCVDPTSDPYRCGSCSGHCDTGEACVDSECVCEAGRTSCAHGCYDLQDDVDACGACDVQCVGGALCELGSCACAVPELTLCEGTGVTWSEIDPEGAPIPVRTFTCHNTTWDAAHCGGCGRACLGGVFCWESDCDMRAGWLKVFSGAAANATPRGWGLEVDASGHLFALGTVGGSGPVVEHDAPGTTLATSAATANVVIKLTDQGTPLWVRPLWTPVAVSRMTLDHDGNIWVGGQFRDSAVVDGVTLAAPADAPGNHGVLVKLSGVDGSLLFQRVIPGNATYGTRSRVAALETTSDGDIVVVGGALPAIDLGSGAAVGGSTGFLARFDSAGAHQQSYSLPAEPILLELRDGTLPVVGMKFTSTITVAGVQMTAFSGADELIAMYDGTGTATSAFRTGDMSSMWTLGSDVVVHRSSTVYRYTSTGGIVWSEPTHSSDFHGEVAYANGRLFVAGVHSGAGVVVLGRTLWTGTNWIAELDPASGELLAMGTFTIAVGYRYVLGLRVGSDRVWLAASHNDTITAPGFDVPSREASGVGVLEVLLRSSP